jgi:hypothetical protein
LKIEQMVPLDPVAFYSVGSIDWIIVFDKRAPRPADEKAAILEEGLQQLDIALALNAEYEDAMTYRNLLLREKAILAPDPATKQRLIAEADDWFNKALQLHRKHQESGQPSGPSSTVDLVPPPSPPPPPPPPRAGQNGTRSGSSAPGGVVSGDLSHEGQKIEDRR